MELYCQQAHRRKKPEIKTQMGTITTAGMPNISESLVKEINVTEATNLRFIQPESPGFRRSCELIAGLRFGQDTPSGTGKPGAGSGGMGGEFGAWP
jgi:hypothetical protein